MDITATTREAAYAYVDRLERRDWAALAALLSDDVVYEMPQTRERIRGRDAYLKFNMDYPGDWHLEPHRILADGPGAALRLDVWVGAERLAACVWLEVTGEGRITRILDYWPEPYEPPPGREHLVERW